MNLGTDLALLTKLTQNGSYYLNIKCKTMKLLENIGENVGDLGIDDDTLDTKSKA